MASPLTTNYQQSSSMSNPAEPYKLNNDSQELNRLDVQHRMWSLMTGGLYPSELTSEVNRLMMSSEPRILDVGCGSGVWAIEMAERFPRAQVIGVDITPFKRRSTPPNFFFTQLNLIDGLPTEYTDQFNIVHCRCVCQHVPEPQDLVNSITKCVKPGGLILLPDGEWIGFDEERKPLEPFIYDSALSIEENIANACRYSCYAGWLELIGKATRSPKYQLPNKLLKNTNAVRDIVFRELWAPTGWAGKGVMNGEEIGAITRLNMNEFFQTSTPVILGQGVPPAVVDVMKERAVVELNEKRQNVWYYVSAVALDGSESHA